MDAQSLGLGLAFSLIAAISAAVGQAGASGYIAAMAFADLAPMAMKVTALCLNMIVAGIGTGLFLRAGRLSLRNIYPFAVLGFPFSVLGGMLPLPGAIYHPVVGLVLFVSRVQMARGAWRLGAEVPMTHSPPFFGALATGAAIGFVSGTTGTGGGVFLAPVILMMGWANARQTAATTAVYNLMNSAAALLGAQAFWGDLPAALPLWGLAVAIGGSLGAVLGSRTLSERWLRGFLALLLFISGLKLMI
ncbi:sulfite exporter TauE/SafE family protein [Rhodobacter lacus]|uniref:Probable membrane transporter protein n=1 Tax=Rhodobacter lacus TaxID=1641972 RepID=A0ABW5ABH0_9RHOB